MLAQSQGLSENSYHDYAVNQFSKAMLKPDSNVFSSRNCLYGGVCVYDLLTYPTVVG